MLMSIIAITILNIYERSYYFIEKAGLDAANLLQLTLDNKRFPWMTNFCIAYCGLNETRLKYCSYISTNSVG